MAYSTLDDDKSANSQAKRDLYDKLANLNADLSSLATSERRRESINANDHLYGIEGIL